MLEVLTCKSFIATIIRAILASFQDTAIEYVTLAGGDSIIFPEATSLNFLKKPPHLCQKIHVY